METNQLNKYQPPIDQLLTYGEAHLSKPEDWPDYRQLGIGPEHIPELIRMATDEELNLGDSESLEVWAPMHAWRALGQLRADAAVEPLLRLREVLEDDDWIGEDLPSVFGLMGAVALPALEACLVDDLRDEWVRITAASSMEKIGNRWPEARAECVALLMQQLELFRENEPTLNAFLISYLTDLHATEAAPLMQRAFAANSVDLIVQGDWDDVQVELGLKSPTELPQRPSNFLPETPFSLTAQKPSPDISSSHQQKKVHAKVKNKMAKQSRKKNRKR
jgi:hypothetical protein